MTRALTTSTAATSDEALAFAVSSASPREAATWLHAQVAEISARGGRAPSTLAAYAAAAVRARPWLDAAGVDPAGATPRQAAACLLALATGAPPYRTPLSAASVRLTATAVRLALVSRGGDASAWCGADVRAVLKEIDARRAPRTTSPIRLDDLRRMVGDLAPTEAGQRIRAALLVGYGGALRVGEICALRWSHVTPCGADALLSVKRKGHAQWDQVALLAAHDAALCPVRALAVIQRFHVGDAKIFPAVRTVQNWVTGIAQRVGIGGSISSHSLRHGWATDAATAGVPLSVIQRHLGHASPVTTSRYAGHAQLTRWY